MEQTRKLTQTAGTTYYVTIPQEMIKQLKWRKGERKIVRIKGKQIIIEDWPSQGK